jgi:hypothetical protein
MPHAKCHHAAIGTPIRTATASSGIGARPATKAATPAQSTSSRDSTQDETEPQRNCTRSCVPDPRGSRAPKPTGTKSPAPPESEVRKALPDATHWNGGCDEDGASAPAHEVRLGWRSSAESFSTTWIGLRGRERGVDHSSAGAA